MKISSIVALAAVAGVQSVAGQQTYPSWCDDIAEKDKSYILACGGDGLGADGLPAWCGDLDASLVCVCGPPSTLTPSCCDGMDAATRQYVVGCNGEDWGSVGGGGGGGGGGEGGGGGDGDGGGGGTSNAVMSQGRIIVGASLISSALTTWMLL